MGMTFPQKASMELYQETKPKKPESVSILFSHLACSIHRVGLSFLVIRMQPTWCLHSHLRKKESESEG